tara:strand:+ start:441 stop:956 length:516 start_codon:yes stop_codon:yes gene_type:complete
MNDFIQIKTKLDELRKREYKTYNINIKNKPTKKIENVNTLSYDVKVFQNKIKKQQYYASLKNKKSKKQYNMSSEIGDDLASNISIQDNKCKKIWTQLTTIVKKEKIKHYLDSLNLPQDIYDKAVSRKVLKKDVIYDIFESKIIKLNFLEKHEDQYIVKKVIKKKKKKKIFK